MEIWKFIKKVISLQRENDINENINEFKLI